MKKGTLITNGTMIAAFPKNAPSVNWSPLYMISIRIFMPLLYFLSICMSSTSVHAEVFFSLYTRSAQIDTGPRRTTGLWGKLLGHFSMSDHNYLVRQFLDRFETEYSSREGWMQLPVDVDYLSFESSDPSPVTRDGLFGSIVTDAYRSFSATVTFRLPVLTPSLKPQGMAPSFLVSKIWLAVFYEDSEVARIELKNPASMLSEVSLQRQSDGELNLTLSRQLREELREKLNSSTVSLGRTQNIYLKTEILTENQEISSVPLHYWKPNHRSDFNQLFYLGKTRFFNPEFYKMHCASLLRKSS